MVGPDDDLLARVAHGAGGIGPGPSATDIVGAAVRRRRQRHARAVVVAAVVVVALAVVSVSLLPGRDDGAVPAERVPAPNAVADGLYRPAGFFEDVVGGRAVPTLTRYRAAPGERFFTRFEWSPPGAVGTPYLGSIALETVEGSPTEACAALLDDSATCRARDGGVLAAYDVPAQDAAFDPVHEVAPFGSAAAGRTVRGVTFLRDDGAAVSVVLCDCARDGAALDEPPVGAADLEPVVTDDSWTLGAGGS